MQKPFSIKRLESDRIIYGSFWSKKILSTGDITEIVIRSRIDGIGKDLYCFQMRSDEVALEGKVMQKDIMDFAFRNQIPYHIEYCAESENGAGAEKSVDRNPSEIDVEIVTSREEMFERIEKMLPLYREFGQQIVDERFGTEYRFVLEENYSDTMWKLDLWLEKDGKRVELDGWMSFMGTGFLEWMDLAALTQYDPMGVENVFSLYSELTEEAEWQDTIREALNEVQIKMH